jgi:CubicO group peptidase (beta-lactamase class C family)
VLLGALTEAASRTSYYDYVRENVFVPAGMTSTDSLPESEDAPNRSVGYSTVGDLARFADGLTSHELLSPGSTELLRREDRPRVRVSRS